MRTYILASHGELASGILDSAKMIIGKLPDTEVFCMGIENNPEEIARDVEKIIDKKKDNDIIIITDVIGGSVHMALMNLAKYEKVHIISGMNLTLVLELFLSDENKPIESQIREILDKAKNSIVYGNDLIKNIYEEVN